MSCATGSLGPFTEGPTDGPSAIYPGFTNGRLKTSTAEVASLSEKEALRLPRILCLHGGGANATVFEKQLRSFIPHLTPKFRLCYAEAPFECDPHPNLVAVYGEHAPFRRWLRWKDNEHPEIHPAVASYRIKDALLRAMKGDDEKGATGQWVGILGFSQGAKIAASILYTQQRIAEELGREAMWTNFRFGVFMAGQAPLVILDPRLSKPRGVADAGENSIQFCAWPGPSATEHVLRLPTLHVCGLSDEGRRKAEMLHDLYCESATARQVDWDGAHRVPLRQRDVTVIIKELFEMVEEVGLNSY